MRRGDKWICRYIRSLALTSTQCRWRGQYFLVRPNLICLQLSIGGGPIAPCGSGADVQTGACKMSMYAIRETRGRRFTRHARHPAGWKRLPGGGTAYLLLSDDRQHMFYLLLTHARQQHLMYREGGHAS
jgi:hypothetical protein